MNQSEAKLSDTHFYAADDVQKIFDEQFDFFGLLDPHGKVIELSGRVFDETRTNPQLLSGQYFFETVFWQSSANTGKLLADLIRQASEKDHAEQLLDFRLGADKKLLMSVRVRLIPSEKLFITGRRVGSDGTIVEAISAEFLEAADNAGIGLWYWDFVGGGIISTPSCNRMFDLPPNRQYLYEDYLGAIHPDDREFVDGFVQQSKSNASKFEEEFRVRYDDGRIEWLRAEGQSYNDRNGTPEKMIGVVRSITSQKVARDELERVHGLEKRARDEAVEANRAKDFFLAFVSHELRSPLNAILGWARILLTKPVDEETRTNALETIERSARVQTKLINDLVDSARVASGRLRLEFRPTNLHDIAFSSFQAQKPAADAKKLDFQFSSNSDLIALYADSNRLQQVFGNLISNAIKFTPEGGTVRVHVEALDDRVDIVVSDTGLGIDAVALPNIFRQFSQVGADQMKMNTGLGLGLSIVKILVGKHRGTVRAESEGIGSGAKFTVVLPLSQGENGVTGDLRRLQNSGAIKVLRGVKIFIVEDDPDSREVLQLFIQHNGADVASFDSVKSAYQAISTAGENLPHIVISDIGMPEEDGYSLIRKVRMLSAESGGSIPALALSAFASEESKEKAFEAGFDKYSMKPFEPDQLIRDIVELLTRRDKTRVQ